MKADKIKVNSLAKIAEVVKTLTELFNEHKYVVVSFRIGRDRTVDQNALWHKMYERIAQMSEIGDFDDARRYCKLHHGVVIMRRDDEAFRDGWNKYFLHLTYEEKLEMMGPCALFGPDGFPVTRLFNRKQGIDFTDRIVAEFSQRGVVFDDLLKDE